MIALSPGPAPGLVTDFFTGWFVALVVAATALVWLTVAILRVMDRAQDEQPVGPAHVVNDCDRGGHYYTAHQMVWRCVNCGDRVPRNEIAYDQEQDAS